MRTKFRVDQVYNNGQNVSLVIVGTVPAVYRYERVLEKGEIIEKKIEVTPSVPPPPENMVAFDTSHAEPGGELRYLLLHPDSAKDFTVGREFFVDITPAG